MVEFIKKFDMWFILIKLEWYLFKLKIIKIRVLEIRKNTSVRRIAGWEENEPNYGK